MQSAACYRSGEPSFREQSVKSWARWIACVAIACWASAFACDAKQGEASMLTELNSGKYRVGQVWRFKPRPGEDGATLTVVRVDSSKALGVIVHVSVEGVHIKNPRAPGGFSDTLQHAPFSEEAIEKSVTTLVGETKTLPAHQEGYREWRKAFDAGKAGVFTITVAEAVGFTESAINR
jgi:hypothetical protein